MAKILTFANKDEIREQACDWIMRLESPDIGKETVDELICWLDQNAAHRAEFFELASIWGSMDILLELAEVIPLEEKIEEASPVQKVPRGNWYHTAAASFVGIAVLAGMFFLLGPASLKPEVNATYSTVVGGQDSIELPDGSQIVLNTNSRVKVTYDDDIRHVYLERGEAHFEVEGDPTWPFIVHVGAGTVKAIGTAFNVQYRDDFVAVLVTQGTIEVDTASAQKLDASLIAQATTDNDTGSQTKASISEGQSIEFDKVIRNVNTLDSKGIDQKLAWQRGMLIFDGEYLDEVIYQIARYTDMSIIVEDESIKKIQIGGYFKAGEVDAMLSSFEASFGIAVNRVGNDLVLLSAKPGHIIK